MRHVLALVLALVSFGGALVSQGLHAVLAAAPHAALMEIDDTIQPISVRFLSRGLKDATDGQAQFLVVVLDTPGGLFSSTRDMVRDILSSEIPVVVYVSPAGARAASAGTFIAAAAHVAAMAPTTNIGAASPVAGGGQDLPETVEAKAKHDAAAFMRSIADKRGRNKTALEATVLNAESYTATQAKEEGIVDLVARDLPGLLTQLDGRSVLVEGKPEPVLLRTQGLVVRKIEETPIERFLSFIANPDIAFMLLSLGMLGIFIEFLSPGLVGPGVAGAIALALAMVAMGNLPVNWVGVGLLGLSMVLLFIEMQAPGIGVFGVAGVVSFVLGGFLLFGGFRPPPIETPSFRVNIWLIAGVAGAMFGVLLFLVRDLIRTGRLAAAAWASRPILVGETGVVTTDLSPRGTVHVAGEQWSAVSDSGEPIPAGQEVLVSEAEGLTLKVFRSPLADKETDIDAPSEEPA